MKQLKRLDLKKSTTLNDVEMKGILGGKALARTTCAPCGQEGFCTEHQGDPGVWGLCTPIVDGGVHLCVCVATSVKK